MNILTAIRKEQPNRYVVIRLMPDSVIPEESKPHTYYTDALDHIEDNYPYSLFGQPQAIDDEVAARKRQQ